MLGRWPTNVTRHFKA